MAIKKTKKALIDINKKTIKQEEYLLLDEANNYLDTKYYPLNLILSGDLFKGIPLGQMIMFGGKPQTGKSYIAELISHQITDNYDSKVRWFDIENAFGDGLQNEQDIIKKGFNTDKFELIKLPEEKDMWTVEEFGVVCDKILDDIKEEREKNDNKVNLIVLDSLNSLPINKEKKDVKKFDAGQDMGQKSKIIQRVFKPLIQKAYKTKTTFIIINQVYDVPSLFPGQLPKFSGGNFTQFMASRMILFMTYDNKNENKENKNRKFQSNRLYLLAFKNRSIVKGTFINAMLSYEKGLHRFYDICSLIPKIYEPLTDKNTKYKFNEWKLYNADEQTDIIQTELEQFELNNMFDFNIKRKLDTINKDNIIYNYYVVSTEHTDDIISNKKLILVDTSEANIDIDFIKSNETYTKIVNSNKLSIIRFTDDLCKQFTDITLVKNIKFKDSSYCAEDEYQALEWNYFKVNSTKSKIKSIKKLKYINKPINKTEDKELKLETFDMDFINSKEFEELQDDTHIIVRLCSTEIKSSDLYKKNGTLHFTKALLQKLNPYFNDVLLYKNDNTDFKMDDETDILELI